MKGQLWNRFLVRLVFQNKLCGSIPLSKELVRPWLESRMPKNKPEEGLSVAEIEKEVLETIDEQVEKTTLGFQQNENGFFVRGGTIKAHLKDCSNVLKDNLSIKALRSKVANKIYIEEYHVPILKDDKLVTLCDGTFDQPVHVITPLGPRNALKTIQYIEQPTLIFHLCLLEDKEITEEVLRAIFDYGSIHGYGGERGLGEGRYSFMME